MINNCGLYVHIPFCLSKCVYCDFVSYAGRENLFEPYVGALIKEIKHRAPRFSDRVFDTVYFGGGTPTLLPSALTADIMSAIKDNFAVAADAEITTEANPATIDGKKAEVYLNAGFNRVSVGMQSADDKTLAFLGRAHNVLLFEETVKTLKTAGFDNINADFMLGLPGQTQAAVGETVDYLDRLGVRHISAYSLILEKGTPLYSDVKKGKTVLPDDDFTVDLYDAFFRAALRAGFGRYEVSNFAKKSYECRHNLNCWKYSDYLGLGASAHSFFGGRRCFNVKSLEKYIQKASSTGNAISDGRKIPKRERMFEYIMLSLRTADGLDAADFADRFGEDFFELYGNIIKRLVSGGCVAADDGGIRIREDKFYILNSIITEFII